MFNESDYDGESYARDEIEYRARMEALEDARDEARAAGLAAEALECAENDEAEERELILTAAYSWASAMGLKEAA